MFKGVLRGSYGFVKGLLRGPHHLSGAPGKKNPLEGFSGHPKEEAQLRVFKDVLRGCTVF